MPHLLPPTSEFATWVDLEAELDLWAADRREATLWWRDDDAVEWTDALARLLGLAGETSVALAVVPKSVDPSLADRLAAFPRVSVLPHGWAHHNHAPDGGKKGEFGSDRPLQERCAELALARSRLRLLFGGSMLSVLVPPWNRIGKDLPARLPKLGYVGLSTVKPRAAAQAVPELRLANVHVDLVDWRGGRTFIGEGRALAGVLGHLRERRTELVDTTEPTGILTHHLVQDEPALGFMARLLKLVSRHQAARFLAAPQVFAAA